MSETTSDTTGRRYGIRRVRNAWERSPLRGQGHRMRGLAWGTASESAASGCSGSRERTACFQLFNQIPLRGIRPSFGFVEEPETNGIAARWKRTLKEQDPRMNLPAPRGGAGRRGRVRGAIQRGLASREGRLLDNDRGARTVRAALGGVDSTRVQIVLTDSTREERK